MDQTEAQPIDETGLARVMGENVRLRESADIGAPIIAELNEGANLTIVSRDGKWLKVSFGILQGFIHSDYVFEITEEGLNGTIVRDGVNVREDSSIDSNPVTQLPAGTGVQVTDYQMGWYRIAYHDLVGYVHNDCIMATGSFTGETSTRILMSGMSGEAVKKAQTELKRRGFFVGTVTGYYGPKTAKAVKDFQRAAKISVDGVAGEKTLALLYGNNNIKVTTAAANQVKGRVKMTEWSKVNKLIPRGAKFTIIDVRTGISWTEIRHGGYLHIDSEPVTASDTAKMKSVYGGKRSWNRAIWVVYGNNVFAASMNSMPHGSAESIGSSNNFKGVKCIHFYKSITHGTKHMDQRHQACVLEAYKAGK